MCVAPQPRLQLPPRPEDVMEDQPRVLLTVEEAAEQLAIGRTAVYALLKSGELDSVRIGRLRRIPAISVENYVQQLITTQTAEEDE